MVELPRVRDVLASNRYPGRGLVAARSRHCELGIVYFLTGRSAASKDRDFLPVDDTLAVVPSGDHDFDPLRHYTAVTRTPEWVIVGNGDQVSTIEARLVEQVGVYDAVQDLAYEPDPPLCTSRITMLAHREEDRLVLSAARHSRADRAEPDVMGVSIGSLGAGEAVILTTYESDGEAVATAAPYVEGTTEAFTLDELLDEVWAALNPDLRVMAVAVAPHRDRYVGDVRHA